MNNSIYRKELDGIRAIAVFSVILYHSGIDYFRNGYLGVDVFFVISGFLITNIIINEISNDNFNLLNFFERRARRILPLLFFVTLISIPFSSYFLSPNLLENYSQSIISLCLFASNFLFWMTTGGYFDLIAELKPLIHTWSLSVEIQFYLIFPFIVILLFRKKYNFLMLGLIIISIISIIIGLKSEELKLNNLQILLFNEKSVGSFYLIFSRAWELLLGGIASLIILNKKKIYKFENIISIIGFIIIILSLFFKIFPKNHFVINSIYPCIGIFLLIIFTQNDSILQKILSNKIIVFFGTISFSLYMWHQPIFSLIRIHNNSISLSLTLIVLLVFVIILISFISYKYIEKPYRNKKEVNLKKFIKHIVFLYFIILIAGLFIYLSDGLFKNKIYQKMYPNISFGGNDILTQNNYREEHLKYIKNNKVIFSSKENKDKFKILVIGDSKGADLFMALNQEDNFKDNILFDYIEFNLGLDKISFDDNFKIANAIIITLNPYNTSERYIVDLKNFFISHNKNFFITHPYPYFKIINDDPTIIAIHKWHVKNGYKNLVDKNFLEKEIYSLINNNFFKQNKNISKIFIKNNIKYLNPMEYICPEIEMKKCIGVTDKFEKIYFDNTHTTLDGSEYFGKIIYRINWLDEVLN